MKILFFVVACLLFVHPKQACGRAEAAILSLMADPAPPPAWAFQGLLQARVTAGNHALQYISHTRKKLIDSIPRSACTRYRHQQDLVSYMVAFATNGSVLDKVLAGVRGGRSDLKIGRDTQN